MTLERISIEWRPVANLPGIGHLYLVAREVGQLNSDGYAISIGPSIPGGPVNYGYISVNEGNGAGSLLGNNNTIDQYNVGDTELSRGSRDIQDELLVANPDMTLDQIWTRMIASANDIHNQQIRYDPTEGLPPIGPGVNSNSVITTLLSSWGIDLENVLPNQAGLEDTPVASGLFPGQDTLIATTGDDVLKGYSGNDLFYVASGGNDVFYGGADVKTFFNIADGLDRIKFAAADQATVTFTDFGGGETGWTYSQRIGSEVSAGTLYSIERFSGAKVDLFNKIDMSSYTGSIEFRDQTPAEIQNIQQTIDPSVTSSVRIYTSPTNYMIADNFGTFTGSGYNDTFTLNTNMGRVFNGGGGVDTLTFGGNMVVDMARAAVGGAGTRAGDWDVTRFDRTEEMEAALSTSNATLLMDDRHDYALNASGASYDDFHAGLGNGSNGRLTFDYSTLQSKISVNLNLDNNTVVRADGTLYSTRHEAEITLSNGLVHEGVIVQETDVFLPTGGNPLSLNQVDSVVIRGTNMGDTVNLSGYPLEHGLQLLTFDAGLGNDVINVDEFMSDRSGPRDFCGGERDSAHRPKFTRPKPQGSHFIESDLNRFVRASERPHDYTYIYVANDSPGAGTGHRLARAV